MPKNRVNRTIIKDERLGDPLAVSPRLLPLKAAATYLGLTVPAIRERIWDGLIPVVRFPGGTKMFIDVKDLDDFIEEHKGYINKSNG
jgi:excisionase family DNA binding protein